MRLQLSHVTYLHSDRHANNHGLFHEFLVEFWRMVVHVEDGDKDFGQAVLSLRVLSLHVEVVLEPHLCIQGGPGLRVNEAG